MFEVPYTSALFESQAEVVERELRTQHSSVPVGAEKEVTHLLAQECIKSYTSSSALVNNKWEAYSGSYLNLPPWVEFHSTFYSFILPHLYLNLCFLSVSSILCAWFTICYAKGLYIPPVNCSGCWQFLRMFFGWRKSLLECLLSY